MFFKPTRPALTKLFAVLSASFLLGFAAGTRQVDVPWVDTPLGLLKKASRDAFDRRDYERSADIARRGIAQAAAQNHRRAELTFLQMLAANRMSQRRYADALPVLLRAEALVCPAGNNATCARIESNLANLYLTVGDYESAHRKSIAGLAAGGHFSDSEAPLRITLGRIAALRNDSAAAEFNLQRGVELADRLGTEAAYSFALLELGRAKLVSGDIAGAEALLSAAFRRQLLQHDPNIAYSYLRLAALKLRQGDPHFALRLNDFALEHLARGDMALASYFVWQERGPILEALGDRRAAADCYRRATDLAGVWRDEAGTEGRILNVLADGLRGSIYDRFVALSASLAVSEKSASRAWDAFAALEENRSYTVAVASRQPSIPEMSANKTSIPAKLSRKATFRENFLTRSSLPHFQTKLSDSEAFFSFAISRYGCQRWSISRDGFTLDKLDACAEFAGLVARFREALENQRDATPLGAELYRRLLGGLPAHAAGRPDWLFSLDDALWELPLAALVPTLRNGKPVYLMEGHSLTVVPRALLLENRPLLSSRGHLVGVGDPVYNLADARRRPEHRGWFSLAAASTSSTNVASLNRLVASGGEVRNAAYIWASAGPGQLATVLTGIDATRERLFDELKRPAAVLHIAAHVLPPKAGNEEAAIAVSINRQGILETIGQTDISAARLPGSLVILNGCSSGRGEIHRGAGLVGLTRAWLTAGAGAVISSQWDMPDDASGLFPAFYRSWVHDSVPAAEALRRAQVKMLHSGTWRANPGIWAAYSITGAAR